MTLDPARRASFLDEMGLGPVWIRRAPGLTPSSAEPLPEAVASVETVTQATRAMETSPPVLAAPQPTATQGAEEVPADPLVQAFSAVPVTLPAMPTVRSVADMGWAELEQAVSACTRCGLCGGRNRAVFGVGDRRARWMYVGEGPGREEDARGEPFAGRAGKLLDNMLASLRLARTRNAYIANVVKCRPVDEHGKDRRPSVEETAACLPYLQRQIELVQPDVIVALGKTAAVSLLGMDPETPVSSLRGKVHRYKDHPLVVTYHPAYLLRTPEDKKKAWADLCLAAAASGKAGTDLA